MRDRRNAIVWAIGMWFMRRALSKRAAAAAAATEPRGARIGGWVIRLLKLGAVVGIAYAAWRKFAGAPKTPTL